MPKTLLLHYLRGCELLPAIRVSDFRLHNSDFAACNRLCNTCIENVVSQRQSIGLTVQISVPTFADRLFKLPSHNGMHPYNIALFCKAVNNSLETPTEFVNK
jgi:hypothetical protein